MWQLGVAGLGSGVAGLGFDVAVGCGRSRFWCGRSSLDVAVGCGRSRF